MVGNKDIVEAGKNTRFQPGNKYGERNKGKEYITRYRERVKKHAAELPEGTAPHEVLYDIYTSSDVPPDLREKAAKHYDDIVNNTEKTIDLNVNVNQEVDVDQALLEQLGYLKKEDKQDEQDSTS